MNLELTAKSGKTIEGTYEAVDRGASTDATRNTGSNSNYDYTLDAGNFSFAPYATNYNIPITIVDDALYEVNESFDVRFTVTSGNAGGGGRLGWSPPSNGAATNPFWTIFTISTGRLIPLPKSASTPSRNCCDGNCR